MTINSPTVNPGAGTQHALRADERTKRYACRCGTSVSLTLRDALPRAWRVDGKGYRCPECGS